LGRALNATFGWKKYRLSYFRFIGGERLDDRSRGCGYLRQQPKLGLKASKYGLHAKERASGKITIGQMLMGKLTGQGSSTSTISGLIGRIQYRSLGGHRRQINPTVWMEKVMRPQRIQIPINGIISRRYVKCQGHTGMRDSRSNWIGTRTCVRMVIKRAWRERGRRYGMKNGMKNGVNQQLRKILWLRSV
jgi:hypothetical protein